MDVLLTMESSRDRELGIFFCCSLGSFAEHLSYHQAYVCWFFCGEVMGCATVAEAEFRPMERVRREHRLFKFGPKFGQNHLKSFNFVFKLNGPKLSSVPFGPEMKSGWAKLF